MRGKKHSDKLKAQVTAALLLGASVTEVARRFSLPQQTVSTYKAEIPPEKFGELRSKKGKQRDNLLYDSLTASLESMARQAEAVGSAEYLEKQSAKGLALLHGVMADTSIYLFELLQAR